MRSVQLRHLCRNKNTEFNFSQIFKNKIFVELTVFRNFDITRDIFQNMCKCHFFIVHCKEISPVNTFLLWIEQILKFGIATVIQISLGRYVTQKHTCKFASPSADAPSFQSIDSWIIHTLRRYGFGHQNLDYSKL